MIELDAKIARLLSAYFEGALGDDQYDELETWVNANDEHAALLIEHAQLGRLLGQQYKLSSFEDEAAVFKAEYALAKRRMSPFAAGLALAAALALSLTVWFMTRPEADRATFDPVERDTTPVAVLMETDDVVWASNPVTIGDNLPSGMLRVVSGTMHVQMVGGASVTLIGPFEFVMESADAARLNYGTLRAEAPGEAAGFTVHTPGFDVVDLGTAFAVYVQRDGSGQVAVTQGVVEVRSALQAVRLVADQHIRFANDEGLSAPTSLAEAGISGRQLPTATDHAKVVLDGIRLSKTDGPGASDPRKLYTQTFTADPGRRLVGIECVTADVQDAGADAEFGIFAITLTTPIGVEQAAPLGSRVNRDIIADATSPPTDGGWRRNGEYFDASSFPASIHTSADSGPMLSTSNDVTYHLVASPAAPATSDTWIIKVGEGGMHDILPGRYVRVSLLFSAVGFNPVGPGANNGTIILHYDDGTTRRSPWDLADSNGAGLMPAPAAP